MYILHANICNQAAQYKWVCVRSLIAFARKLITAKFENFKIGLVKNILTFPHSHPEIQPSVGGN